MVSLVQVERGRRLSAEGLKPVELLYTDETPIPGLLLYASADQRRLELVRPDGSTVNLLAVYRAAEDCVRNWGEGSDLPKFVGDFRRLNVLAAAVNGSPIEEKR